MSSSNGVVILQRIQVFLESIPNYEATTAKVAVTPKYSISAVADGPRAVTLRKILAPA